MKMHYAVVTGLNSAVHYIILCLNSLASRQWSFWQKEATVQVRHSTSHKVQSLHVMAGTIPEGT